MIKGRCGALSRTHAGCRRSRCSGRSRRWTAANPLSASCAFSSPPFPLSTYVERGRGEDRGRLRALKGLPQHRRRGVGRAVVRGRDDVEQPGQQVVDVDVLEPPTVAPCLKSGPRATKSARISGGDCRSRVRRAYRRGGAGHEGVRRHIPAFIRRWRRSQGCAGWSRSGTGPVHRPSSRRAGAGWRP